MAYKNKQKEKEWRERNRDRINHERREKYRLNPENLKERTKKYYHANRERMRNANRKYHYGIEPEQYYLLLEIQDGRCKICNRSRNEFKFDLAVDHCHDTGRIRGLLCTNCNTALGLFKHNMDNMRKAIDYLQ